MKNLLTGLLLATTSTLAFAQENSLAKGKIYVGGSLGFSTTSEKTEYKSGSNSTKFDGPKSTSFTIMPSIGYMLSDKLAIGLGIGYSMNKVKEEGDGDTRTTTNGALVFAPNATYFLPLGGSQRFGLTLNGAIPLSFGTTKHEREYNNVTTSHKVKVNSFGFAASPGIYYFPVSRFMLTAQMGRLLNINSTVSTDKDGDTTEKQTTTQFEVLNFSTMGLSFGGSFFF